MNDRSQLVEHQSVGAGLRAGEGLKWHAQWQVKKYRSPSADVLAGRVTPDEVITGEGNLAMNGGVDVIWKRLITLKPSTGLASVTSAFSTKAALAVGNSSATSTASQTDIQAASGATNRARRVMDSAFPSHTTGTSTTARSASFQVTFTTAQANFAWKEWGLFNTTSTSAGAFRMLNRKVAALGTKTSAATWQLNVKLTIS